MSRIRAHAPLPRLLLLLLACLAASSVRAQSGSVSGRVTHSDGTPADFVTVFVESKNPPVSLNQDTDEDGKFSFVGVQAGDYKVYGFETGLTSDVLEITVTPGSTARADFQLRKEKAVETTVTVHAKQRSLLVDVKKTDVSSTVTAAFIKELPLQNTRIQDIAMLFAGVSRNGGSDSTDITVGGGSGAQVGYRLNGASMNDPISGGALLDLPSAAIASFKLITNGFDARYGQQSSAIAEIVTKSGSNTLASTYSVDFRSTKYGAWQLPGLKKIQDFWYNTLGPSSPLSSEITTGFPLLGVPRIVSRDDDHNPTPRYRIRQDLSTSGPIVKDKVYFASTLESLTDDYGNPFVNGWTGDKQTLYTNKIDWKRADNKHRVECTTSLDVTRIRPGNFLDATHTIDEDSTNETWQTSVVDTRTFAKNLVLETQVTAQHSASSTRPSDKRTGVGTQYQIPLPPGGFESYTTGAANTSSDRTLDDVTAESTLTKQLKKHSIAMGANLEGLSFKSFDENGPTVVDFRITDDRRIVSGPSSFAGRVIDAGPPVRSSQRTWQSVLYATDDWSVTKNLTLNLGLRGDYQDFIGKMFVAPRFGVSLDPIGDGKTRFFGNWGIFYDNIFANAMAWESNPDRLYSQILFGTSFNQRKFSQTAISTLYDAARATPLSAIDALGTVAVLSPEFHDRYRLAKELTDPTTYAWSVGLERALPGHTRIQLAYKENNRAHQLDTTTITRLIPQYAGYILRDLIYETAGKGHYVAWTAEIQKAISDKWQMNINWTRSRNTGPIAPPSNPADPTDVISENGIQGNDRTTVIKMQTFGKVGSAKHPLDVSSSFLWQTGQPLSAQILTSNGQSIYPFGRNTLRLPPSRQLDFGIGHRFETGDHAISVTTRIQLVNLLNETNVIGGLGRFRTLPGQADPLNFPPFRATVIANDVDVSRSAELHLAIDF